MSPFPPPAHRNGRADREGNRDETPTGALGQETTTPKARAYFSTSYYHLTNR